MILYYPFILLNSTTNSEAFSPVSFLEMKTNNVLIQVCSDSWRFLYFDVIICQRL